MDESDAYGCDVPIRQYSYSSSYSTRWKVEKTSSGAFRIAAGTGGELGFALAVGSYVLNINGIDIEQRTYTNDSNYQDEWFLFDMRDAALLAVPEADGRNRSSFFNNAIDYMQSWGYDDIYTRDADISWMECIGYLASSKITVFRSHGNKTGITTSDGHMTRSDLLALGENALSPAKLVIYGACSTGSGGLSANNLVTATEERGAETVIGFMDTIYTPPINDWCRDLFSLLSQGRTIKEACDALRDRYDDQSGLRDYIIAGNSNLTFN